MAMDIRLGGKRALIDKANTTMLVVIGVTSLLVTFSLVSCKALFSLSGYQSRVIDAKEKALKQLKENSKNVKSLVTSYETFATAPVNVLGGNPKGTGPLDGDNPKIVLDALPSKYDYPGLVTGMTKLLSQGGYKTDIIGGSDDEIAQLNSATDNPAPVEIPLPIGLTTTYDGAQQLLLDLERSIRPIYVSQLSVSAAGTNLTVSVSAKTFYMPEKTLKIGKKVVK
jgi:hypothetical protein